MMPLEDDPRCLEFEDDESLASILVDPVWIDGIVFSFRCGCCEGYGEHIDAPHDIPPYNIGDEHLRTCVTCEGLGECKLRKE